MLSEPQVKGPLKTNKRQWTRQEARIIVGLGVLSLTMCLVHLYMTLQVPNQSLVDKWLPSLFLFAMLLYTSVPFILDKEKPLLSALRRDYADPVYPEQETRLCNRIRFAWFGETSGLVVAAASAGLLYQHFSLSRPLADLGYSEWLKGGAFILGISIYIKSKSTKKRLQAEWYSYVSLRDSDKTAT